MQSSMVKAIVEDFGNGGTIDGDLVITGDLQVDGGGSLSFDEIITGNSNITGTLTVGSDGSGSDVIFYSGTAGDNFTWDASAEKLTITGTDSQVALAVADGNVTITDDLDVDGTTNLDVVDIDGAVQLDATLTVGADDQGYDVIFYGNTASSNMTWDTSEDDLVLNDATLKIDQDDNVTALEIDSESTSANVIQISGSTNQTANILNIVGANALTSGSIVQLTSDSDSTTARNLVYIAQESSSATSAVGLKILQSSTAYALSIDQNENAHAIFIDSESTTQPVIQVEADVLTTGGAAKFYSNSSTTGTRNLVDITNDDYRATGTTCLTLRQDSAGSAIKATSTEGYLNHGSAAGLVEITHTGNSSTNANNLLYIKNDDAGSSGTKPLFIDQDANNYALEIDSEATTSVGAVIDASALTTGKGLYVYSASSDTGAFELVHIQNDNASATGATCLKIKQDSTGPAIDIVNLYAASGSTAENLQLLIRGGEADLDPVGSSLGIGFGYAGASNYNKTGIINEFEATNGLSSLHLCTSSSTGAATVSKSDARLTITSAGLVGIGIASPDNKMHIRYGDVIASNANVGMTVEGSPGHATTDTGINILSTAGGHIYFGDAASAVIGRIDYIHTDDSMRFYTGGSERMRIDDNSRISLSNNDSNTGNTVFGKSAFNTSSDNASDYNTAFGELAMGTGSVAGAINCVAIGYKALEDITSGDYHIAIGASAMGNATAGEQNVAIGNGALGTIDTGESHNIAIGTDAMTAVSEDDQTADGNIAIGTNALRGGDLVSTSNDLLGNIAIGYQALDATGTNASTGQIAIGYQALTANTSGAGNTAVGYSSLTTNVDGGYNTAVGWNSLLYFEAASLNAGANTVMGSQAGKFVSTGTSNTFIGADTGLGITGTRLTGANNTAVGQNAGVLLQGAAANNTLIGQNSGSAITTGGENTAIGGLAGSTLTTGSNNIFLGQDAGSHGVALSDGNLNIIIGNYADTSATDAENQVVIGYNADGQANNSVTLGNADVTDVYMAQDKGATIHCDDVRIADGGTIGSVTTPESMAIASTGYTQVNPATKSTNFTSFSVNGNCLERPVMSIQANLDGGTDDEFNASGIYGLLKLNVVRAASSAYNILTAISGDNVDLEFRVRGDGEVTADGSFTGSGADYAEYFESKDGNVIAVGKTVKLDGDKVVACEEGDTPIGVVRPKKVDHKASMTVGNAAWNRWTDKYLTDDFGRYIREEYTGDNNDNPSTRRKQNPDFVENLDEDGLQIYSPREDRDEWHIIGLLGQIPITKGQPTGTWIKMKDVSDTVEMYFVK